MDFEYEVNQEGDTITVVNKKIKDGEKPAPMAFEFIEVDLRMEGLSSAVLKQVETKGEKTSKRITGENQKKAFAELEKLHKEQKNNLMQGGIDAEPMVLIDEWKDKMKSVGIDRRAIQQTIKGLVNGFFITIDEPYVKIGDSMDDFIRNNS